LSNVLYAELTRVAQIIAAILQKCYNVVATMICVVCNYTCIAAKALDDL